MSSQPDVSYMKSQTEWNKLHEWIDKLRNQETRENSLVELCRARGDTIDLAIILWNRADAFYVFQEELLAIFSFGNPANLTPAESIYVRHILYLLHCVASHPITRLLFLNSQFPLFLYPFLNMAWNAEPFEPVRHGCLDIISTLIQGCEQEAIQFLLTTEFIPIGLRIMEFGSAVCKSLASFVVYKMLINDASFVIICQRPGLVENIIIVLKKMLLQTTERSVAYVKRCLRRFIDNESSRAILRAQLKDFKLNDPVGQ